MSHLKPESITLIEFAKHSTPVLITIIKNHIMELLGLRKCEYLGTPNFNFNKNNIPIITLPCSEGKAASHYSKVTNLLKKDAFYQSGMLASNLDNIIVNAAWLYHFCRTHYQDLALHLNTLFLQDHNYDLTECDKYLCSISSHKAYSVIKEIDFETYFTTKFSLLDDKTFIIKRRSFYYLASTCEIGGKIDTIVCMLNKRLLDKKVKGNPFVNTEEKAAIRLDYLWIICHFLNFSPSTIEIIHNKISSYIALTPINWSNFTSNQFEKCFMDPDSLYSLSTDARLSEKSEEPASLPILEPMEEVSSSSDIRVPSINLENTEDFFAKYIEPLDEVPLSIADDQMHVDSSALTSRALPQMTHLVGEDDQVKEKDDCVLANATLPFYLEVFSPYIDTIKPTGYDYLESLMSTTQTGDDLLEKKDDQLPAGILALTAAMAIASPLTVNESSLPLCDAIDQQLEKERPKRSRPVKDVIPLVDNSYPMLDHLLDVKQIGFKRGYNKSKEAFEYEFDKRSLRDLRKKQLLLLINLYLPEYDEVKRLVLTMRGRNHLIVAYNLLLTLCNKIDLSLNIEKYVKKLTSLSKDTASLSNPSWNFTKQDCVRVLNKLAYKGKLVEDKTTKQLTVRRILSIKNYNFHVGSQTLSLSFSDFNAAVTVAHELKYIEKYYRLQPDYNPVMIADLKRDKNIITLKVDWLKHVYAYFDLNNEFKNLYTFACNDPLVEKNKYTISQFKSLLLSLWQNNVWHKFTHKDRDKELPDINYILLTVKANYIQQEVQLARISSILSNLFVEAKAGDIKLNKLGNIINAKSVFRRIGFQFKINAQAFKKLVHYLSLNKEIDIDSIAIAPKQRFPSLNDQKYFFKYGDDNNYAFVCCSNAYLSTYWRALMTGIQEMSTNKLYQFELEKFDILQLKSKKLQHWILISNFGYFWEALQLYLRDNDKPDIILDSDNLFLNEITAENLMAVFERELSVEQCAVELEVVGILEKIQKNRDLLLGPVISVGTQSSDADERLRLDSFVDKSTDDYLAIYQQLLADFDANVADVSQPRAYSPTEEEITDSLTPSIVSAEKKLTRNSIEGFHLIKYKDPIIKSKNNEAGEVKKKMSNLLSKSIRNALEEIDSKPFFDLLEKFADNKITKALYNLKPEHILLTTNMSPAKTNSIHIAIKYGKNISVKRFFNLLEKFSYNRNYYSSFRSAMLEVLFEDACNSIEDALLTQFPENAQCYFDFVENLLARRDGFSSKTKVSLAQKLIAPTHYGPNPLHLLLLSDNGLMPRYFHLLHECIKDNRLMINDLTFKQACAKAFLEKNAKGQSTLQIIFKTSDIVNVSFYFELLQLLYLDEELMVNNIPFKNLLVKELIANDKEGMSVLRLALKAACSLSAKLYFDFYDKMIQDTQLKIRIADDLISAKSLLMSQLTACCENNNSILHDLFLFSTKEIIVDCIAFLEKFIADDPFLKDDEFDIKTALAKALVAKNVNAISPLHLFLQQRDLSVLQCGYRFITKIMKDNNNKTQDTEPFVFHLLLAEELTTANTAGFHPFLHILSSGNKASAALYFNLLLACYTDGDLDKSHFITVLNTLAQSGVKPFSIACNKGLDMVVELFSFIEKLQLDEKVIINLLTVTQNDRDWKRSGRDADKIGLFLADKYRQYTKKRKHDGYEEESRPTKYHRTTFFSQARSEQKQNHQVKGGEKATRHERCHP